jgi:polyhydroxyalkanoate synthase
MGGTLAAIHAALHNHHVGALCNLLGPIDFSQAGFLGHMVKPEWFDPHAIAAAGNVNPLQMQSGFVALRPTLPVAKWVGLADRGHDGGAREAFFTLEEWSSDNVPFPGAAYATYIRELYQENRLVRGEHHVAGRRVDLTRITCPVVTVVADRDNICPPAAATALNAASRSPAPQVIEVPGGHVGAVVGGKAAKALYPALTRFFTTHLRSDACNSPN